MKRTSQVENKIFFFWQEIFPLFPEEVHCGTSDHYYQQIPLFVHNKKVVIYGYQYINYFLGTARYLSGMKKEVNFSTTS